MQCSRPPSGVWRRHTARWIVVPLAVATIAYVGLGQRYERGHTAARAITAPPLPVATGSRAVR